MHEAHAAVVFRRTQTLNRFTLLPACLPVCKGPQLVGHAQAGELLQLWSGALQPQHDQLCATAGGNGVQLWDLRSMQCAGEQVPHVDGSLFCTRASTDRLLSIVHADARTSMDMLSYDGAPFLSILALGSAPLLMLLVNGRNGCSQLHARAAAEVSKQSCMPGSAWSSTILGHANDGPGALPRWTGGCASDACPGCELFPCQQQSPCQRRGRLQAARVGYKVRSQQIACCSARGYDKGKPMTSKCPSSKHIFPMQVP